MRGVSAYSHARSVCSVVIVVYCSSSPQFFICHLCHRLPMARVGLWFTELEFVSCLLGCGSPHDIDDSKEIWRALRQLFNRAEPFRVRRGVDGEQIKLWLTLG